MSQLIIKFSYNWNNKLACNAFTTLRLRNDAKYIVDRVGDAYLKDEHIASVRIVAIKHFTIDKINELVARVDTGYSREETVSIIKRMYKNYNLNWDIQQLSLIMLSKIKN